MTPNRSNPSPSDNGGCGSLGPEQGSSKRAYADSASPITMAYSTLKNLIDQRPVRVYIIPAKISPTILADLASLIEKQTTQYNKVPVPNLQLTTDSDSADVLVTVVRTRPRLERHISWDVAKTKAIVFPDWLRDSVSSGIIQPYMKYAAQVGHLHDGTEIQRQKVKTDTPVPSEASPSYLAQIPSTTDPEISVKDSDIAALDYLSNFCCQRASPLTCSNQRLVEELEVIRRARLYEGEERSMLSYARAIAAIKACPYYINNKTSREDIAKLPYLGAKLTSLIEEFIKTGKISEAQNFLSSTRFVSLSAFNTIHGIGPNTARQLYSLGLRKLEDLDKYYEVVPGMRREDRLSQLVTSDGKEVGIERSVQISLTLRHDLSEKILRQEAEEIHQVIMQELEVIEPGCKSIIVGGYRRGKQEGNDVDIIISHTDWDHGAARVKSLCKKLVQKLHERGLVKYVLNMSGYHTHNVFRTHHWDSLEKALTVFLLPYDPARKQIYRRVDLIFATPDVFWTAVVGWTGSTMFERDLRLWAKQKGFKFDSSGISRRHDSKLFYPKSEREVFGLLGLAYVHPTLRNADV